MSCRLMVHGGLTPRSQDRQRTSSWGSRFALVAFVAAVPLLHWGPLLRYIAGGSGAGGAAAAINYEAVTAYDVLGGVCVLGAIWLNATAAKQLGKVSSKSRRMACKP